MVPDTINIKVLVSPPNTPDIKETCKDSNLIILHTDWDEFKSLDFRKLVKSKKFKLYDLRNLYNFNDMLNKKIEYYSIGRPSIT